MNAPYQRITELFGAPKFDPSTSSSLPRKRKGDSPEASRELGSQCLNDGDYEAAIQHFKDAIELGQETSAAVDLAGAYEYAEMAPQALIQYEAALKIKEDEPEPYVGLSQIFKRNAQYRDAATELEDAIKLDPDNAFYRHKLAEILREIGERDRAVVAAQGAVACAPSEHFYHYWLGDLLIEMQRFDEALNAFRAAIEMSPGDDFLYQRAAIAFWGAGRQIEAVKAIRIASDLDPANNLYYGVLELFLTKMGMAEEATLERPRAAKMDDYDLEALRRLGIEGRLEPFLG
ncbi:MAG: tetratricopeptide repeat protein [Fimbriimonadaceae bacterium]